MNEKEREVMDQALEACPFCGETPSFSGDVTEWKDDARYVELSLGCCASMTETIGWRRAGDMTPEARAAELRGRLRVRWNARAQHKQAAPVQESVKPPRFKITVIDNAHPNGIPYQQWVKSKQGLEQETLVWHSIDESLNYLTYCADGTTFLNTVIMPNHAVSWAYVNPPK